MGVHVLACMTVFYGLLHANASNYKSNLLFYVSLRFLNNL